MGNAVMLGTHRALQRRVDENNASQTPRSWRPSRARVAARTRRALAALALCLVAMGASAPATAPARTWLWAWERPEDLRFLAREPDVGVAFLAATVRIDARGDATVLRRRHPLRIADRMPRIAVVRIEREPRTDTSPRYDEPRAHASVIGVVREVATLPRVLGVQLDHDARESERAAYVRLLGAVRAALPRERGLTMTALASWCSEDAYLAAAGRHVDAIVPMVFAMGREGPLVRARLQAAPFDVSACRAQLGVSIDEPALPSRGADVWAFSTRAWTPARFARLRARTHPRFGDDR